MNGIGQSARVTTLFRNMHFLLARTTRPFQQLSPRGTPSGSACAWLLIASLGPLLISPAAAASECAAPQHDLRRIPEADLDAFPTTATLWLNDEEAGELSEACTWRAVDTGHTVPAIAVLHPAEQPTAVENVPYGCGGSGTRLSLRVAELTPTEPLTPGTTYQIDCETGSGSRTLYPSISVAAMDPDPPSHREEVHVQSVHRIEACDDANYLRLDLDPIADGFFADGGMILVEYTGAVDVIRGVEQHENFSAAYVDLPLASERTLTLRVIDALGVEFDEVSVDVTGVGRDEESGSCFIGSGNTSGGAMIPVWAALLLGARSRRRGLKQVQG